jgi:hypothetical protein
MSSQVVAVLQVHQLPPHHALPQEGEGDDVLWFQVSVDEAVVVKEPQSAHHIPHDVDSMDRVKLGVSLVHELPQIRPPALQHQADHGGGRDGELVGIGGGGREGQRVGCGQDGSVAVAWGGRWVSWVAA